MAETIGWLCDKIAIMELKIHYTGKQLERTDVDEAHRQLCRDRVAVLTRQRDDLMAELNDFVGRYERGEWQPRIYRQYKMYNDPRFKPATPGKGV